MDINIESQIVVQTSAQWAADNTVYSAKRILVTSDVYYGSTDQRKFKIADGVQTWSNLDYMPIEQVTTSTIGSAINGAASATPNDTDLVMSVESSVAKKNTWTQIKAFLKSYFDTVYKATFTENTAFNKNFGTGTTNIVEIGSTLGNSLITSTDANGKLQTLDTSTYPSLTELSYVKGLTSAVQTQLNSKSSVIAKQTTDSSHNGSVTPTIVTNILIPANSMGANDIGSIEAMFYKTGTTDTASWTIYISPTSNSLVGATHLGNAINTAAQSYASMHRTVVNKNSQSTNYAYQQSGGVENPWLNAAAARVAMNQDFSTNLYLIVVVTMGGSTDTGGVDWIYMTKQ